MPQQNPSINQNDEMQQIMPQMDGGDQQLYPPMMQYPMNKADILDKIKPDLIVEIIRHRLMGEDFINGEWVEIPALKQRALSSVGAWDLANLMLSVSSQNVALSKLNDEEIRSRTFEICKTAQNMCLKNWKVYGINGIDQLDFVHQIVYSNTFVTLKQPEGAGIRKMIIGTTAEVRNIQQNEGKQSPSGWFAGLLGGKSR